MACFELDDCVSTTGSLGHLTNARKRSLAIDFHASSLDSQPSSAGWPPQGGVWLPPPNAKLAPLRVPLYPLSERPCARVRFVSSTGTRLSIPDKHRRPRAAPESPGSRVAWSQVPPVPAASSVRQGLQGSPQGASLQAALERLVLQQQSSSGAERPQERARQRHHGGRQVPRFASVLAAAVEAQRSSTDAAAGAGFALPGRRDADWDEGAPSEASKVSGQWTFCTPEARSGRPWAHGQRRLERWFTRKGGDKYWRWGVIYRVAPCSQHT